MDLGGHLSNDQLQGHSSRVMALVVGGSARFSYHCEAPGQISNFHTSACHSLSMATIKARGSMPLALCNRLQSGANST